MMTSIITDYGISWHKISVTQCNHSKKWNSFSIWYQAILNGMAKLKIFEKLFFLQIYINLTNKIIMIKLN